MTFDAAILRDWTSVDVFPGGYVVLLTEDFDASVRARVAGFSLKDTLAIFGPGLSTSYALLYRAPIEGTVIDSVIKYGTGPMNINGSRIKADLSEFFSATGKPRSGMGHARGFGMGDGYGGDKANPPNKGGRWPTNMAFVHSDGCRLVGTRSVTTGVAHRTKSGGKTFGGNIEKPPMDDMTYAEEGGKETIPTYECEQGCFVHELDLQSGNRASTLTGRADPKSNHEHPSSAKTDSWFSGGDAKASKVYADMGGASRFYPQFRNRVELISWICTLVARTGGNIFDGLELDNCGSPLRVGG
jgi:hypothetical protein